MFNKYSLLSSNEATYILHCCRFDSEDCLGSCSEVACVFSTLLGGCAEGVGEGALRLECLESDLLFSCNENVRINLFSYYCLFISKMTINNDDDSDDNGLILHDCRLYLITYCRSNRWVQTCRQLLFFTANQEKDHYLTLVMKNANTNYVLKHILQALLYSNIQPYFVYYIITIPTGKFFRPEFTARKTVATSSSASTSCCSLSRDRALSCSHVCGTSTSSWSFSLIIWYY